MLHKTVGVPAVSGLVVLLVLVLPGFTQAADGRPDYYSEDYTGPGDKGEGQQALVARFRVRLPARADLWFDDQKTKQQGAVRQFVTDKLDPERIYTYRVRARWVEDGITVEKTLRVRAIAGNRVTINFVRPTPPPAPVVTRAAGPSAPAAQRQPVIWRAPVP